MFAQRSQTMPCYYNNNKPSCFKCCFPPTLHYKAPYIYTWEVGLMLHPQSLCPGYKIKG